MFSHTSSKRNQKFEDTYLLLSILVQYVFFLAVTKNGNALNGLDEGDDFTNHFSASLLWNFKKSDQVMEDLFEFYSKINKKWTSSKKVTGNCLVERHCPVWWLFVLNTVCQLNKTLLFDAAPLRISCRWTKVASTVVSWLESRLMKLRTCYVVSEVEDNSKLPGSLKQ